MGNLTLNTKTYNGAGLSNGVARYYERSGGVPASFSEASSSLRDENGKWRGLGKLNVPVVATEATACACPGVVLEASDAQFSFRIDPLANLAARTDLYLRFKDFVGTAEVRAMFENLQGMTG